MSDSAVGAVILAGGLARRMGGIDKGLVLLAGKPMAGYTLDTVRPLVDLVVINANRNQEAYRQLGARVISDNHEGHLGPLAGLSAAIAALDTEYIFMCPCDSPFIQPELVDQLVGGCQLANTDIAVAHDGERLQPVFCVVHRRVQKSLDSFLGAGERKIDRWFGMHRVNEVAASRFSASFRNINTEDERLSAEKSLQS